MKPQTQEIIRGRSMNVSGRATFIFGGEFHYFRIPHSLWTERLKKARAAFINCIGFYIPWNLHEQEKGTWNFDDDKNIREWIKLIKDHGLKIFARPGPYICSEWDMGGLPSWLIGETDSVRTIDPKYMAAVRMWFREVNAILSDFVPEKDGNLILYQIENEFIWGELQYFLQMAEWVRCDGITVPIITNLNPSVRKNTPIADSLDLYPGPWNIHKPEIAIDDLLCEQPEKLAACVEFQMGFAAEVGGTLPTMTGSISESWVEVHLKNSIARGLNFINFYMFCGGTTWGYHTGRCDISSYDYESAIREWGELDGKYFMIRRIGSFLHSFGYSLVKTLPSENIPVDAPRGVSVLQRRGKDCLFVFPRNLTGTSREISFTVDVPDEGELTVPSNSLMRLSPRSIKMLPFNVPLSETMHLVYCTSEIFGLYRLEDEIILVVYGKPGETGEIMIRGFEDFDHCRGNAVVEKYDGRLLVSFMHCHGAAHILLADNRDEEMSHTLGGVRIIVADTDTASHTWPGIRGDDLFPIVSDIYFMDMGACEGDVLSLQASVMPDRNHFIEFPCNCSPVIPPTVFLDGEQLENVSVNKIMKTVRVELPAIRSLKIDTVAITGWRMYSEDPLSLNEEEGWEPYNAFCGNEHSGRFEPGYYGYRCSFEFNGSPEGMILHLTELHDNATVYLNGASLGGATTTGNNGAWFSADVSKSIRKGTNELFVLLESEGRPRKGDEAAVTGITGPVTLTGTEENISLVSWRRSVLRFESESMLSAIPSEAEAGFNDNAWETVEVKPGWDSRNIIPPSTTYIEHGHERLYVVYRTNFILPEEKLPGGVILDVEKADGKCWIYLNGRLVDKKHQERFCADLTPHMQKGENILVIIIRNFRWYTTIGLHGNVYIRFADRVLGDGWEFIRGLRGERAGLPEGGKKKSWSVLKEQEITGPAWLAAEFRHKPIPGWTAPLGLRLSGWNAKINIYLNGFLIGRYHPEGPQERFYLPEDHLSENNRIVLLCNAFGKAVKIGKAEIEPYYVVKDSTLEIRF